MGKDVCISYAEKDEPAATTICETLESKGVSCWIAPRNVQPGAIWAEGIMDAISASRVMVLVFSEHASRSVYVRREVQSAFDNGKTVIPFRLSNTKPTGLLAFFLKPVQWIDAFTQPTEEHSKTLAAHIRSLLSGGETEVTDSATMTVFRKEDDRLTISLQGIELLAARLDLGATKGLLGPSTNSSDQRGFHNQENTLFGLNKMPCTKASNVHFFVLIGRNFVIINDVNARVARLLDEPFSSTAHGFLRIESIKGTPLDYKQSIFEEDRLIPRKSYWSMSMKRAGSL